jgi:cytoskeletal protein CcmA (bactofilin family)
VPGRCYYLGQMSPLNRRQVDSTGADAAGSLASLTGHASPRTVLKAVKIDGQISAHEDMYLDTDINGPITSDSSVTVGPLGVIQGEVKGRQVVVFGRVVGDIEATEKVELHQGAEVIGDIYTFHISLDEKASFKGRVDCRPLDDLARPVPPASETRSAGQESQSA